MTVCKQALRGKRRLKRDFGAAAEAECNQTLGLLATIYYFKGSLLDAEALRRKFSHGFSYYHPEHELEFIVKHPKLCQEVFGKKIVLDWRRGVLFELLADVPCKDILTPINEMGVGDASISEESKISASKKSRTYTFTRIKTYNFKNRKSTNKPLQTLHNKLRQYEHSNQDTAEVVRLDNDETFGASGSDSSGLPPSRTGTPLRPSLTWRVVQSLGTVRRSVTSQDDWATPPTPDTEQIPSPLRPKFGKGFWSKSDNHIFKLKKAKTRLQKRKSDESVKTSFSVLNGEQQRLSWSQTNSTNPPADGGMAILTLVLGAMVLTHGFARIQGITPVQGVITPMTTAHPTGCLQLKSWDTRNQSSWNFLIAV
ncbi:hypothetical protein B0O99DRAFT_692162 [Bisporella sp. PMI_857]|nr:hypothetical protein B0O99DRAFT_692162 [Bisporella sp. PMI_857]